MSLRGSHRRVPILATVFVISLCAPAQATFHSWQFKEIFSNDDGTIQFIELFTTFNSQQFATGQIFRASQDASTIDYTFPSDTPSPTAGHHLLLATAGFAALPGAPTPDFIIPDGFLFTPDGKIDNLAPLAPQVVYVTLPTDGVLSLAGDGTTTATNSPTNYNGDTASIDVSVQDSVPTISFWGGVALVLAICIAGTALLRARRLDPVCC